MIIYKIIVEMHAIMIMCKLPAFFLEFKKVYINSLNIKKIF